MIRISDIRNTLGESSNDLGTLCKSNHINKWSWNKPINSSTLKESTDTDRFLDNDGFDISTHYLVDNTLAAKNRYESGVNWIYRQRTAPFRLGDFSNYDSSAQKWFDVSTDLSTLIGIDEDDVTSFHVLWKHGKSYIPEVFQFKFSQDSSIDSFGYICWFSNTPWPYYYHKGIIQQYNGSGQIYPYNDSEIFISDFPKDVTGTIVPVLSYTNRLGVSNRLYNYDDTISRNFKFLCVESNSIPIKIDSTASRLFDNIQVVVYWDQGSITGNYKSFGGAIWFRNRNQQNVPCSILIYNTNSDPDDPDLGADTVMYDNDVSLAASPDGETWSLLELLSGDDLDNTSWYENTPSDVAMFYINISINNKHITLTPTADSLPKTLTYNLSDYI